VSGPWRWTSPSHRATEALGAFIGRNAWAGLVVALAGDLGAGKTCMAGGIARGLGVPDEVPVVSPTFTLINPYPARIPLYHVDFYRLEDPEELEVIGFADVCGPGGVTVVEWPDRFPEALPSERLEVTLRVEGPERRGIEMVWVGTDPRGVSLMARIEAFCRGEEGEGGPKEATR